MLPHSSKNNQPNLFYNQLRDMLDSNDPLVALADTIKWEIFDESFEKHYSEVKFRNRIGTEGVEQIFSMSVALHGKDAEEKQVIIDTTVQEKNVTYPTDGKLAIKMIHHLHTIARNEGIQLRRTYIKD